MSDLIVLSFESESDAAATLQSLRQIERAGHLSPADTAIVTKDPDGKVHYKNELDSGVETGAVVGGILGGVFMFMFPVAGIAIGAAAGGLAGKLADLGIDKKFEQDIAETLQPGSSALFLLSKSEDPNAVMSAVRGHKGKVLQTNLPTGFEDQLRAAIGDKS
jgi:uncharacterized membrane protein